MKKLRVYTSQSPFLFLGALCLVIVVGSWGWAISQGMQGCAYCFWQRVALGSVGISLILLSQSFRCWQRLLLKGLSALFCGAGIVVAWSHLTATFQAQVMGLARLMGTLSQAGDHQKILLLEALKTEMSLQWMREALPFWSLVLFGALLLLILTLREKRS